MHDATIKIVTGLSYLDKLQTVSCHSRRKRWTEVIFFNKIGYPALPLRGYFLPQSHDGCLDWKWWN